jgi:hypothetical protein
VVIMNILLKPVIKYFPLFGDPVKPLENTIVNADIKLKGRQGRLRRQLPIQHDRKQAFLIYPKGHLRFEKSATTKEVAEYGIFKIIVK